VGKYAEFQQGRFLLDGFHSLCNKADTKLFTECCDVPNCGALTRTIFKTMNQIRIKFNQLDFQLR